MTQSIEPNDYRIEVAIGREAVVPEAVAQAIETLGKALAEIHGDDVTGHGTGPSRNSAADPDLYVRRSGLQNLVFIADRNGLVTARDVDPDTVALRSDLRAIYEY